MITREDYNKALDIVEQYPNAIKVIEEYHKQLHINSQYIEVVDDYSDDKTLISDWIRQNYCTVRLLSLLHHAQAEYDYMEDIIPNELRKFRSIGDVSINEFIAICGDKKNIKIKINTKEQYYERKQSNSSRKRR